MLEGGEDPLYVARRLVRMASEDVGLADPSSLVLAVSAFDAVRSIGMPEGALALAEITVHLSLAPKSNAVYRAYGRAVEEVRRTRGLPVPLHLRNAPTRLMEEIGYGDGYEYAHDARDAITAMDCLPEALRGTRFYEPSGHGHEADLARALERIEELRAELRRERDERSSG
jgi:putative ATPase